MFPVWYFCVSGVFLTFSLTSLCDLGLIDATALSPFTAAPIHSHPSRLRKKGVLEQPSTIVCSPRARKYWWHKIISELNQGCAGTCLYLSEAGKSFWSALSCCLTNYTEIFQGVRSQQPLPALRAECILIVSEFLHHPSVFLSPP